MFKGRLDDHNRNHGWSAGPRHLGNGTRDPAIDVARPGHPVCVYLKVGDTPSLRYRRDGTPDCASVQQDSTDASITRGDLRELTQQITRSIEELRRDIGAVRREMEHTRNELENIRRETRQPRAP
jgi:hypothetical protein